MDLNKFSNIINDRRISEPQKLEAIYEFYDYYSNLVEKVLKNKSFSERQLSVDIFRKEWSEKKSEIIFKKQLYASFTTLKRIKKGIETGIVNKFNIGVNNSSIENFSDFLFIFSFDVFQLVKYAEVNFNNTSVNYNMIPAIGSSSRDIYENSSIILHIKHFKTNSIHYRDFFSYAVFANRLLIEVSGKNILGIDSITNDKGERIKGIKTQIAWNFIKFDQSNKKRIVLPIEVDTILEIEKWTNRFIHTGYIQPIFLVENALFFLDKLSNPYSTQIREYDEMKSEFESFVKQQLNDKQLLKFNWKAPKYIEAKII
ncbi:hypothetical protein IF125_13635 [Empedobacter stercoris]|uniref:hypothetical protein n=1 Tax=Empedobacter stercoris TaxID=1628248 RepID=UPI001CE04E63|nr:hypothetical protein [Empedobacter stercoris]MCA4783280.1 hypothetical protein [Empedobacter stercoris]